MALKWFEFEFGLTHLFMSSLYMLFFIFCYVLVFVPFFYILLLCFLIVFIVLFCLFVVLFVFICFCGFVFFCGFSCSVFLSSFSKTQKYMYDFYDPSQSTSDLEPPFQVTHPRQCMPFWPRLVTPVLAGVVPTNPKKGISNNPLIRPKGAVSPPSEHSFTARAI